MNAAIQDKGLIRGWCPGALRPMESGDGLIVRIRPFRGALSLDHAAGLADLAERLGNGHIDLTRRANLQIRGLTDDRLPALHEALGALGLLDRDEESEARRNVMVSPLAGLDPSESCDVRPIAAALERALVNDTGLKALPGKFGFLVDGGGSLSIAGERADVALAATGNNFAFGLDTPAGTGWLGFVAPERAVEAAIAAAHAFLAVARHGRMRDHSGKIPIDRLRAAGLRPAHECRPKSRGSKSRRLGLLENAVGVGAPFGRLEASQIRALVALAARRGAIDLRLSPWRSLYFSTRDPALLEGARAVGLIVSDRDPLLRVEACPGAPSCRSSSVDARGDARSLAALAAEHGYSGRIHVSGCAKGCACSAPCDLTLIGEAGSYRIGGRRVVPADFPALLGMAVNV